MRILTQRTVAASCVVAAGMCMGMSILINYVPMYFQAARGFSPGQSGQYLLSLVVPDPISTVASGVLASMTGYYVPYMTIGSTMLAVGAGLLSTLGATTELPRIFGFEAVTGIGFGFGCQLPLTSIRNSMLNEADIPIGNALFIFFQGLGVVLAPSTSADRVPQHAHNPSPPGACRHARPG